MARVACFESAIFFSGAEGREKGLWEKGRSREERGGGGRTEVGELWVT